MPHFSKAPIVNAERPQILNLLKEKHHDFKYSLTISHIFQTVLIVTYWRYCIYLDLGQTTFETLFTNNVCKVKW